MQWATFGAIFFLIVASVEGQHLDQRSGGGAVERADEFHAVGRRQYPMCNIKRHHHDRSATGKDDAGGFRVGVDVELGLGPDVALGEIAAAH